MQHLHVKNRCAALRPLDLNSTNLLVGDGLTAAVLTNQTDQPNNPAGSRRQ
jgi:hypothetical protein